MSETFQNYINGQWVDARSGATFESRNPARQSDLIGTFPQSGADDVAAAVEAAKEAFKTWKMFPAILSGNTVVFKPSEDAPHSGMLLVQIMHDAGVPPGVVNLVQGAGATGAALVEHPDVQAISFTGSSETGAALAAKAAERHARVSLEMGGKNPVIVMDDADVDLAVEGLLWGAYGTTGQRCTATSRLIVHESVHDEVVEKLSARAPALRLGFRAIRDLDAGITYINGPTIGAEAHMSFGGVKATGNGHREGGWEVYDFYTETKTVYVDFSGGLQRAQIDNYQDALERPDLQGN